MGYLLCKLDALKDDLQLAIDSGNMQQVKECQVSLKGCIGYLEWWLKSNLESKP